MKTKKKKFIIKFNKKMKYYMIHNTNTKTGIPYIIPASFINEKHAIDCCMHLNNLKGEY